MSERDRYLKDRSAWLHRLGLTYSAIGSSIGALFCTFFLVSSVLDPSLSTRNPIQLQMMFLDAAFIAFGAFSIRRLMCWKRRSDQSGG